MRKKASEIVYDLETRIARLEARKASFQIKMFRSPVIIQRETLSDHYKVSLWCSKSEIKNVEGFGEMNNGEPWTHRGSVGPGANPMMCTTITFEKIEDFDGFLDDLSSTYTLIEAR